MKILDITADLETLALTPNAAIMQIAAVAWKRDAEDTPFFMTHWTDEANSQHSSMAQHYIFDHCIDLRSCVSLGMDFDQKTVDWWRGQKDDVKAKVLGMPISEHSSHSVLHIYDALSCFLFWANDLACEVDEQGCQLRLWSQGSDFDIAIIRNAAQKCGLTEQFNKVFPHTCFRDARTFILELGRNAYYPHFPLRDRNVVNPSSIYQAIPSCSIEGQVHDALFDCETTTWNLWQIMKAHRENFK